MKALATFTWLPLVALGLAWPATAGKGVLKVEIKRFRFGKHPESGSERLVLEFARRGGKGTPGVRVAPNVASRETVVHADGVSLVGGIPEAPVNDLYASKAQFLGPLTFNADGAGRDFSIRVTFKSPEATVKAFWLEQPSRLVIDVFRSSAEMQVATVAMPGPKAARIGGGIVCFNASAKVDPAAPGAPAPASDSARGDEVVCYRTASRLSPRAMQALMRGSAPVETVTKTALDEPTANAAAFPIPVPPPTTVEAPAAPSKYGWDPRNFSANRPIVPPPALPAAQSAAPTLEGAPVVAARSGEAKEPAPKAPVSAEMKPLDSGAKPAETSDRKRTPSRAGMDSLLTPLK